VNYFVYIVKCKDKTLYTGIATDLKRRIKEHNGILKGGAKYTRGKRPVKLIHSEKYESRIEASRRESEIKKMTRVEKEIIIEKMKKS